MVFQAFFQQAPVPVLVCRQEERLRVQYLNPLAKELLGSIGDREQEGEEPSRPLREILYGAQEDLGEVYAALARGEVVRRMSVILEAADGVLITCDISAGPLPMEEGQSVVLYLDVKETSAPEVERSDGLHVMVKAIYRSTDTEEMLRNLVALVGKQLKASRGVIAHGDGEEKGDGSYLWLAPGVDAYPMGEGFARYLAQRGERTVFDVEHPFPTELASEARALGLKALVCMPILAAQGQMGYVRFDDLAHVRAWNENELILLEKMMLIVTSFIYWQKAERSRLYSLEIFDTVINNFDGIIYVVDLHTKKLLFVSRALARTLNTTAQALLGEDYTVALGVFGWQSERQTPLEVMVAPDGSILKYNHEWEQQNSRTGIWYLMRDIIIKWADGRDAYIGTAVEITRQKEHEKQLEYVASTDVMTETYNREWGRKLLQQVLEQGEGSQTGSLVFLDLDGLKGINDRYGHAIGDEMIVNIVRVIQSCVRKSDLLCRWGGDEFILLLRAEAVHARQVMEKITNRLCQINQEGIYAYQMSFSYGIVEIKGGSRLTVEQLVAQADRKMYENKPTTQRQWEELPEQREEGGG